MKAKIVDKALELGARMGIRSMSMDDLARELGISKKTIYQYYTEKEALVMDCMTQILDSMEERFQADRTATENPLRIILGIYSECLRVILRFPPNFFSELKKYYPKVDQQQLAFREKTWNEIRRLLKQAEQKCYLRPEVKVNLACELYLFSCLDQLDNSPVRHSTNYGEILEHLVTNYLRGLLKVEHMHSLNDPV